MIILGGIAFDVASAGQHTLPSGWIFELVPDLLLESHAGSGGGFADAGRRMLSSRHLFPGVSSELARSVQSRGLGVVLDEGGEQKGVGAMNS